MGKSGQGSLVCSALLLEVTRCAGHKGSIWKVRWAHPEFGAVLVSCSFDHKVRVWEETRPAGTGSDGVRYPSKWRMAAELSDARKNVVDVEFAPRHLGLKFVRASPLPAENRACESERGRG